MPRKRKDNIFSIPTEEDFEEAKPKLMEYHLVYQNLFMWREYFWGLGKSAQLKIRRYLVEEVSGCLKGIADPFVDVNQSKFHLKFQSMSDKEKDENRKLHERIQAFEEIAMFETCDRSTGEKLFGLETKNYKNTAKVIDVLNLMMFRNDVMTEFSDGMKGEINKRKLAKRKRKWFTAEDIPEKISKKNNSEEPLNDYRVYSQDLLFLYVICEIRDVRVLTIKHNLVKANNKPEAEEDFFVAMAVWKSLANVLIEKSEGYVVSFEMEDENKKRRIEDYINHNLENFSMEVKYLLWLSIQRSEEEQNQTEYMSDKLNSIKALAYNEIVSIHDFSSYTGIEEGSIRTMHKLLLKIGVARKKSKGRYEYVSKMIFLYEMYCKFSKNLPMVYFSKDIDSFSIVGFKRYCEESQGKKWDEIISDDAILSPSIDDDSYASGSGYKKNRI